MSVFAESEWFSEFQSHDSHDRSEYEEDEESDLDSALLEYKEEIKRLIAETAHEELKKALRIFQQPKQIKVRDPAKDGPVAHVLLFNHVLSQRREVEEIKEFFKKLVSNLSRYNRDPPSIQPQESSVRYPSLKRKTYLPKASSRHQRNASKAFVVTRSLQIYTDRFYVDQTGEPMQYDETIDSAIPEYDKVYLDALDGEVEIPEAKPNTMGKPTRCCFNCGLTDHQLKDCPTPKDYRSISQRKKEFLEKMPSNSPQAGSLRYHAEKESSEFDPRFANFKPGVIGKELRAALGMGKDDLPPYIYQMRMLGYPPGHLEAAKIAGSGLNMSGTKRRTGSDDSDLEDGMLDVDKIIDYPGFNTKPAKHIRDKHRELNAMPMDDRHSKDIMVSYHTHKNNLLRRKLEKETEEVRSSKRRRKQTEPEPQHPDVEDNTQEVDMDMDGDSEPEATESSADVTIDHANITKTLSFDENTKSPGKAIEIPSEGEVEEGELQDGVEENSIVANDDNEDMGGEDVGELTEDELQIRKETILRRLREQRVASAEGDRECTNDVIVLSSETDDGAVIDITPDDVNSTAAEISVRWDKRVIVVKESDSERDSPLSPPPNPCEPSPQSDLEFHGVESLPSQECSLAPQSGKPTVEKSLPGGEISNESQTETETVPDDKLTHQSAKGLPHRSSFAKGMTQFDAFYVETRSRGVYRKLKGLLKDSPMRQTKTS